MNYLSIPSIMVICYIIAELFKLIIKKQKKLYKGIPIMVGAIGGVIGLIAYLIDPSLVMNSENVLTAIAIGIISGLASTGSNQIIKQLIKKEE